MKKKIIISILTVFLLIIAYALYACLPFAGAKGVSEDFKRNFNVKNFYSDSESGERVMMLDSGADAYFHRLSAIEQAEEQILFSSFSRFLLHFYYIMATKWINISVFFHTIPTGRDFPDIACVSLYFSLKTWLFSKILLQIPC